MRNKFLNLLILVYIISVSGCITSTTNSNPVFSEDYAMMTNKIAKLSNSGSVEFVDIITRNKNDKITNRELRIDLIKPGSHPDTMMVKNIIHALKEKLKEPDQYQRFIINEIQIKEAKYPAEKYNRVMAFDAKDL